MTGQDSPQAIAERFFAEYAQALLNRDAAAVADHYAVPALIEFPERSIAVTHRGQTEDFFGSAFAQYSEVKRADAVVVVVASTPHSIWADVSWDHHGGAANERNMYQLVRHGDTWRIAVLTPLAA